MLRTRVGDSADDPVLEYEAARTRALLSHACRLVGDDDGAEMELDAARSTFDQLGAVPDFARVYSFSGVAKAEPPGRLTTTVSFWNSPQPIDER